MELSPERRANSSEKVCSRLARSSGGPAPRGSNRAPAAWSGGFLPAIFHDVDPQRSGPIPPDRLFAPRGLGLSRSSISVHGAACAGPAAPGAPSRGAPASARAHPACLGEGRRPRAAPRRQAESSDAPDWKISALSTGWPSIIASTGAMLRPRHAGTRHSSAEAIELLTELGRLDTCREATGFGGPAFHHFSEFGRLHRARRAHSTTSSVTGVQAAGAAPVARAPAAEAQDP
ncbi:unnamed protein product [Prorocentrum cordatum]|uniref:Uncharacterized protein n=2 Tax=Prorocentrum cordatum TaxID=2364126 RepID=A0ABN9X7J3_9DINO|nr:unnamed protein product [Polarella glacialis]